MKIDVLVAEIGSTTTVVNAFNVYGKPEFLGQGQAPTSVGDGDVLIGLKAAVAELTKNLGAETFDYNEMLATSSAAGGLRMSVHGLVYDMTVRAAKEAALGAGAVLKLTTAGKLRRAELRQVRDLNPNIILIAGGVDYGERETALDNFEQLTDICPGVPFIYAGNIQNHEEIRLTAEEKGVTVHIVDNVYPRVDELDIEPTRRVIQAVFEEHITKAPGMSQIRSMVGSKIMPTPGAVMEAANLLYEELGDLVVFDVGGATTDLHSVTGGSPEFNDILISPEPFAKRTVEGDLGVFVNIPHIIEKISQDELMRVFPNLQELIDTTEAIPVTDEQRRFIEYLTRTAAKSALERHAGKLIDIYGPSGKKTLASGKDLTAIKYLVATGGALTRLPARVMILESLPEPSTSIRLTPRRGARVLIDNNYIMASLGVLSLVHRKAALDLLKQSLGVESGELRVES